MFKRITYDMLNSISWLLMLLAALCFMGTLFAFAAAVIMGLWDGIVWLTKSDWRTTNFSVPLIAFVAAIVLGINARIINDLIERFEKLLVGKNKMTCRPKTEPGCMLDLPLEVR